MFEDTRQGGRVRNRSGNVRSNVPLTRERRVKFRIRGRMPESYAGVAMGGQRGRLWRPAPWSEVEAVALGAVAGFGAKDKEIACARVVSQMLADHAGERFETAPRVGRQCTKQNARGQTKTQHDCSPRAFANAFAEFVVCR